MTGGTSRVRINIMKSEFGHPILNPERSYILNTLGKGMNPTIFSTGVSK